MLSAVVGGIPGAGATNRTMVNINAGGKTWLSGIIHSTALLVFLICASRYIEFIPLPVLAGILITVGIDIISYKEIKDFIRTPRIDTVIMLIILSLTVFINLFQAVGIGLAMALILFLKKISEMTEDKSPGNYVEGFSVEKSWADEVELPREIQKKVFIKHFDGLINLGFANQLNAMTLSLPKVEIVIMRMKRVAYIDQIGICIIKEAIATLQNNDISVLIIEMQCQPKEMLKQARIIPYLIPEKNIYLDLQSAIQALKVSEIVTIVFEENKISLRMENAQNFT